MKAKFAYTGIRVRDLDATIRFYTQILGMTVRSQDVFDATKGTVVDLVDEEGGHPLELNFYERGSPDDTEYQSGEGLDHLCFKVQNLDNAIAEATNAGHPVIREVRTARSRWVYIRDPNGIWIELSA